MAKKKSSAIEKRFNKDVAAHKSALVEPDINEIGDKRLNPEEAVARERESLLNMASHYAIPGQKQLEDPKRSSGPKIYWSEFLRRLMKLAPEIRPKHGKVYGKPTIALYVPKTDVEKLSDGSYFALSTTEPERFARDYRYVTGFNQDWLPFYSHVETDTSGLPTREIRGVMTVLLMLIRSKVITFEQVKKEFGDPREDQRSDRFMKQIVN